MKQLSYLNSKNVICIKGRPNVFKLFGRFYVQMAELSALF